MKILWSHRCQLCERIFTNTVFQPRDYTCDDCKAKRAALKLPLATATADRYLAMPMTHDRNRVGKNLTGIDAPKPIDLEAEARAAANAQRVLKNRATLRRWKKKP